MSTPPPSSPSAIKTDSTPALPMVTMPALSKYFDGSPIPSFAIDANHVITQWNKACASVTGFTATQMIGTRDHQKPFNDAQRMVLADLIVDGAIDDLIANYYAGKFHRSPLIPGNFEAKDFFHGSVAPACGSIFLHRHCMTFTAMWWARSKFCKMSRSARWPKMRCGSRSLISNSWSQSVPRNWPCQMHGLKKI